MVRAVVVTVLTTTYSKGRRLQKNSGREYKEVME
jgi:hypothetical protein